MTELTRLSEEDLKSALSAYYQEAIGGPVAQPFQHTFKYLVKKKDKSEDYKKDSAVAELSPLFNIRANPQRVLLAYEVANADFSGTHFSFQLYQNLGCVLQYQQCVQTADRCCFAVAEKKASYPPDQEPNMFFFADMEIENANRIAEVHGTSIKKLICIATRLVFGLLEMFFNVNLTLWHQDQHSCFISTSPTKWSSHLHSPVAFRHSDEYMQLMHNEIQHAFVHLIEVLKHPVASRLRYINTATPKDPVWYFFDFRALSPNRNLRLPFNRKAMKTGTLLPKRIKNLNKDTVEKKGRSENDFILDAMILCRNTPTMWNERTCIRKNQFRTLPLHIDIKNNLLPLLSAEALTKLIVERSRQQPDPDVVVRELLQERLQAAFRMLMHGEPEHMLEQIGDLDALVQCIAQYTTAFYNDDKNFVQGFARGIAYVTAMLGFFQSPYHCLLPEYVKVVEGFFHQLCTHGLCEALAYLTICRLTRSHELDEHLLSSHDSFTRDLKAFSQLPSNEAFLEPMLWVQLACAHVPTMLLLEVAEAVDGNPGLLEERFATALSYAYPMCVFTAERFHQYDFPVVLDQIFPKME